MSPESPTKLAPRSPLWEGSSLRSFVPDEEPVVRVLHVISTGERRGAEVFASDLVRSLAEAGLDQHVAVVRAEGNGNVAYEAPMTILGPDSRTVRLLHLDPRPVHALRRLVKEMEPDVIQAHGGEALKFSVAATRSFGTAIAYRKIGQAHPSATRGLRRAVHASLIRRASRVVIVADALRHETEVIFGVPHQRVMHIPNGVDPSRLVTIGTRETVRQDIGIPLAAPLLLSVTAFTWEKDPGAHLAVAARVLRRCRDVFCVLVGDGPMRRRIGAMVRARGLDDRILLIGRRVDVADLLQASDALLLASRTEGMPGCVIEAGMLRVPVAAYAIAGIPEVVKHGTTGLLAPPRDVEGLAVRASELLQDPDRRLTMGRAAEVWCRSRFDISTVAPRYLELYETLGNRI